MPYDSITKIITAPVSIYDVQQALSVNEGDIGSLCRNSAINIWAKFKPVDNSAIHYMGQWDAANNRWASGATWYNGRNASWICGLEPLSVTVSSFTWSGLSALRYAYDQQYPMNGWTYHRPTGGLSSPYRLTDFAGYYAGAPKAADAFTVGSPVGLTPNNFGTLVANFVHAVDSGNNVSLYDIIGANKYFGIAVVYDNGSTREVVMRGTVRDAGVVTMQELVSFSALAQTQKYFTVYPFFSDARLLFGDNDATRTLYTIPFVRPASLEVGSKSQTNINMTIQGDYYPQGQRSTARITIHPNDTYTRCWFELDCGSGNTHTYNIDFVNRAAHITNTYGNGNVHTNRFNLDTVNVDYVITVSGLDPNASYMGRFYTEGDSSYWRNFGIMESIDENA